MDKAFSPTGKTYFVGSAATQIGGFNEAGASIRVRNLSASVQYFTFGASSSITSASAPAVGAPAAMTIGMLPNSVETFEHLGLWMIASSATGFEVTRGDGV